jgi:diguanylate cyclase (GGDEF)-like protein/PAS domain S-box-containing protein
MVTKRRQGRIKMWQVAAVAIVTVGTVGISLGTWTWYGSGKRHNRTELEADAAQVVFSTRQTLDGYNDQIASAAALFTQPGLIDRTEFHSYVKYLDLYNRYKGIYGLGLISWVTAANLPGFVAGWRADGDPGYTVSPPAGNRPAYCLVNDFDESNLVSAIPLIGADLCSFATVLPVLQDATTSGQQQSVAETSLVPGPAYVGNFLLVRAVYSGDPTTVAQRDAQRVGWVAALVNGGQLLKVALGSDHMAVELFSGSVANAKDLIVSSPRGLKSGSRGAVTEHLVDGGTWTLLVRHLPGGPGPANPLVGPAIVFVTSILLNLALAVLVWDLGRGRLRARSSFMESEERFQSMASSSPVGILELSRDGTAQYFNRRLQEIAGVDDGFLLQHNWLDCVHPDDRAAVLVLSRSAWTTEGDTGASFRLVRPSGEVRNIRVLAAPVAVGTEAPSSFVVTVQDVTQEVAATEALAFQAMHDSLTGLPNRALFLDRLSVELAHAVRSGSDLAVMFLDLDGFKVVNDGMGHQAGDELLRAVSARLLGVVRAGETVARLGGDEFTFIFHDVKGPTKAALVGQRILDALSEPIEIGGHPVVVTGSIGIVLPGPGSQADAVLRVADAGMYRAKESGRDRFEIFDEEPHEVTV